jgi:hypothetical protein
MFKKTRKTAIINAVAKKIGTCNLGFLLKGILRKFNAESRLCSACYMLVHFWRVEPHYTKLYYCVFMVSRLACHWWDSMRHVLSESTLCLKLNAATIMRVSRNISAQFITRFPLSVLSYSVWPPAKINKTKDVYKIKPQN